MREGLPWTKVDFVDNSHTLSLIEDKPGGLLIMLDEECLLPQGGDEGW